MNLVKKNEALIILVIVAVALRLPSLWEPYWYGDEGIYLALGQAFRQGLVWYRDIHDNKPPLLYLLAAVAGSVFWFRLLLLVWFGAAVAVFYKFCQKLLPKNSFAWALATLLLIILTTVFEGNIANSEIFIVLPVTLAMLLTVRPRPDFWLIGLLFSAGFLLKVPAVFDFLALLLWLAFRKKIKLISLIKLVLGFSLPIAVTIIYYGLVGGLTPYVRSALLQNVGYLSSWGGTSSGLLLHFGVAALLSLLTFRNLTLIWFVWAMFGALLSGRPYPHYLIQPAVPLAILLTLFIFKQEKLLKLSILFLVLLAGAAYWQIRFWQYPVLGYYQNFTAYLSGQKSLEAYRDWFDPRVNQTYRLAAYIRQTTLPDAPLFIWGDEPYVYALSQRLPVGRYTVAYHVIDFNGYNEVISSWDQRPPKLVVVMSYESRPFPAMTERLDTDYVLAAVIDQAQVYRRLNGNQQ